MLESLSFRCPYIHQALPWAKGQLARPSRSSTHIQDVCVEIWSAPSRIPLAAPKVSTATANSSREAQVMTAVSCHNISRRWASRQRSLSVHIGLVVETQIVLNSDSHGGGAVDEMRLRWLQTLRRVLWFWITEP